MTETSQQHHGGCLCGAIRYSLHSPPDWSGHCHCPSCVKATGGSFSTWVGVKAESFEITRGTIRTCATSPGAERGFCAVCGTSLTYIGDAGWPGQVAVLAPTLDDPGIAKPTAHLHISTRMPFVQLDDGLPAFPEL